MVSWSKWSIELYRTGERGIKDRDDTWITVQ